MKTKIALRWFALPAAVLIACAAASPPTLAAISCGDVLTSSTTLDADLACAGDGLVIGTDGMTLDCAGHAIRGSLASDSVGVRIESHSGVTIRGCTISRFDGAIRAEGAPDLAILDNTIADNLGRVLAISASRLRIESNRFERQFFQITVRESSQTRIARNSFVPGRVSQSLGSVVNISTSPGSVVSDNEFLGAGTLFVHAEATSTVLKRNVFGAAPSGITVIGATSCRVVDNVFNAVPGPPVSNGNLVQLWGTKNCVVLGNRAAIRANVGVYLTAGADSNTIADNDISDAAFGVLIFGGRENVIRSNSLRGEVGLAVVSAFGSQGIGESLSDGNRFEFNDIDVSEYGVLIADATANAFEGNSVAGARYGVLDERVSSTTPTINIYRRNDIGDSGVFGMLVFGSSPRFLGNTFARNGSGPVPPPADDALFRALLSGARGGVALLPSNGFGNDTLDDGDPSNDRLAAASIGGKRGFEANVFADNGDVDILMVDTRAANAATLGRDNRFRRTPLRIQQDWLALVRVQDERGAPVEGATVMVQDARGSEVGRWTTDGSGLAPPGRDAARSQGLVDGEPGGPIAPWASVTEYTVDRRGWFRFATPHRIVAATSDATGCATYSWNGVADPSDDGSSVDGRYQIARVVMRAGRGCELRLAAH